MTSRRMFLSSGITGLTAIGASNVFAQNQRSSYIPTQPKDWPEVSSTLHKVLLENILTFWYPQTLDKDRGGYQLNHDLYGVSKGSNNKRLVVQARCIWFYSRLVREGFGKDEHLEAARIGYEFLRDYLWDKQYGGFYWEVDTLGRVATMPEKHLYGEAFALYALSEYAMASKDPEPLALAKKLFGLLEYYAYDLRFGGYLESFHRDWTTPSVGQSYMSAPHDLKLMNTHLHIMEAFTTYFEASRDHVARERLLELIMIMSNTVLRKKIGACTDRYNRNWSLVRGALYERVSYGHDIENVWLLMDACKAAGIPDGPLMDFYTMLYSYSLQYGYDVKNGGFYSSGPFNSNADNRNKDWWVQAEGLVSALRMYQRTGEDIYYNCFRQTLDWITTRQVDWEKGEWFGVAYESSAPTGDKAGPWKSPYHNGRAMMECLQLVKSYI